MLETSSLVCLGRLIKSGPPGFANQCKDDVKSSFSKLQSFSKVFYLFVWVFFNYFPMSSDCFLP